jgi:hypothetical protein
MTVRPKVTPPARSNSSHRLNILIIVVLILIVALCCCCAGFFLASFAYYGAEGLPTKCVEQVTVTKEQPSTPYPTYTPLPTYTFLPTYTLLPTYTPFPTIEATAALTPSQTSAALESTFPVTSTVGSATVSPNETLTSYPSSSDILSQSATSYP